MENVQISWMALGFLSGMTDGERVAFFDALNLLYCRYCGRKRPGRGRSRKGAVRTRATKGGTPPTPITTEPGFPARAPRGQ